MTINSMQTVKELAVTSPAIKRELEKFGIDYCCGGGRTLADACAQAGVPVSSLIDSLEKAVVDGSNINSVDWQTKPLTELINYILDKHHTFTRTELSRMQKLAEKVVGVHGSRHPELLAVTKLIEALADDLLHHMMKEEMMLFPYLKQLDQASQQHHKPSTPPFGSVINPIGMMSFEHDRAGEMLRALRKVTTNYQPPADACISYQTLYQALVEFEADLHEHIHLENNILFPRALELERAC